MSATAPATIKEVCQTLNIEQVERQNRKKNVVVSNVPEAPLHIEGNKREDIDNEYLCSDNVGMVRSEFERSYRTGKIRKDEATGKLIPRPLVVVFKKQETARYWTNDGHGFHIGSHWVNEDLCRADREAKFFVREERRKRMKRVGVRGQQSHVRAGIPAQDY